MLPARKGETDAGGDYVRSTSVPLSLRARYAVHGPVPAAEGPTNKNGAVGVDA